MLSVSMQDIAQLGDVIHRDAETETQALRQARKEYLRVDFMVVGIFDYSTNEIYFNETIEFKN